MNVYDGKTQLNYSFSGMPSEPKTRGERRAGRKGPFMNGH